MQTDPSGRKVDDTDMLVIKQGYEPLMFTGYFDFWDDNKFSVSFKSLNPTVHATAPRLL